MGARQVDNSLGNGVYFAAADYIGVWRRLAMIVIDGSVLLAACFLIAFVLRMFREEADREFVFWATVTVLLYEAVLKPSRVRTVGYRVIGCRIVTLKGKRPSPFKMAFRAMLWFLGPMNIIFDLGWCGIDTERQTLRDRFAGTLVVRAGAEPIGVAPVHLARISAMGYVFFYPQVTRPRTVPGVDEPVAVSESPSLS